MTTLHRLHIGTSGYSYPDWIGAVWERSMRSVEAFSFYRRHFNSVELNRPFYHTPREKTVEEWSSAGGPDFTWAVKASRKITHEQFLKAGRDEIQAFEQRVSPLLQNGVLLYQLPGKLRKDLSLLDSFLNQRSSLYRTALEFRHNSWFCVETYRLLERYGVALVNVDAPKIERTFDLRTAPFAYMRLHGSSHWYLHDYSAAEMDLFEQAARAHLRQVDLYLFFDNTMKGHGFHNALDMQKRLASFVKNYPDVTRPAGARSLHADDRVKA